MKRKYVIEAIMVAILIAMKPAANGMALTARMKIQYNAMIAEWINKQTTASGQCKTLNMQAIMNEISKTKDKLLAVNKIIDDKKVMYWEHKVRDFLYVKNDSITLHIDLRYDSVSSYQKIWTELEFNYSGFNKSNFKPEDYFWMQVVVFPDRDDLKDFYTFYKEQSFPVYCWEVRYTNGETVLYNPKGTEIGYGIQAPSNQGLIVRGHGDLAWEPWRSNAIKWYREWSDSIQSKSSPTPEWISSVVEKTDVDFFYVIAHSGGLPTRFQANSSKYYTAYMLKEDMSGRDSIKLAVLCCCEAMRETGPGTLSYEFRKGNTEKTVVIGYIGMGGSPGWVDSLDWQDYMFSKINQGRTFKKAFDMACAYFPKIADNVKFVGDENLRLEDIPQVKEINNILKNIVQSRFHSLFDNWCR